MSKRDAETIHDDSPLATARANLNALSTFIVTDRSRYLQARGECIELGRRLRVRNDRLAQRLGELNALEAAANLPLTVLPVSAAGGPEPVTAEDYAPEPVW
ncbi:MAG: hypothetical protein U0Z70_07010 [Thermomicrobiales bacterium]